MLSGPAPGCQLRSWSGAWTVTGWSPARGEPRHETRPGVVVGSRERQHERPVGRTKAADAAAGRARPAQEIGQEHETVRAEAHDGLARPCSQGGGGVGRAAEQVDEGEPSRCIGRTPAEEGDRRGQPRRPGRREGADERLDGGQREIVEPGAEPGADRQGQRHRCATNDRGEARRLQRERQAAGGRPSHGHADVLGLQPDRAYVEHGPRRVEAAASHGQRPDEAGHHRRVAGGEIDRGQLQAELALDDGAPGAERVDPCRAGDGYVQRAAHGVELQLEPGGQGHPPRAGLRAIAEDRPDAVGGEHRPCHLEQRGDGGGVGGHQRPPVAGDGPEGVAHQVGERDRGHRRVARWRLQPEQELGGLTDVTQLGQQAGDDVVDGGGDGVHQGVGGREVEGVVVVGADVDAVGRQDEHRPPGPVQLGADAHRLDPHRGRRADGGQFDDDGLHGVPGGAAQFGPERQAGQGQGRAAAEIGLEEVDDRLDAVGPAPKPGRDRGHHEQVPRWSRLRPHTDADLGVADGHADGVAGRGHDAAGHDAGEGREPGVPARGVGQHAAQPRRDGPHAVRRQLVDR